MHLSSIRVNVPGRSSISTRNGKAVLVFTTASLKSGRPSLTTWLAHSKKKSCDVCKYQYSFTKGMAASYRKSAYSLPIVYAQDMPETIPLYLLLRRVIRQTFFGIQLMLRATLVGFVWLVVLPYGTVVSWKLYFFTGDRMCVLAFSHIIID